MGNNRLLEGEVVEPAADSAELQRLRAQVNQLTRERDDLRRQNDELRGELAKVGAPVARLRQHLEPLYRALQGVWGDIEAAAPESATSPANASATAWPTSGRSDAVWKAWKERLGSVVAKGIDALLIHGELNTQQLAIATGLNRNTVRTTVVFRLNKAGLINKNSGKFSLKNI